MTDEANSRRRDIAPIFVVGAGRSGTTLLRLMLNEHRDIAIPSESHFIAPLLRSFGPEAVLSGAALEQATEAVAASPEWQRDFGHTSQELRDAIGDGPISIAEFFDRVFRLEVGPGPTRWGDKTPANLRWVGALLECFPKAQAIAIVRDPRDVYLSLAKLKWFGETPWAIGQYIAHNGRLVGEWLASCPPERFRVVRYEDLVLDTVRVLRESCDFLGLEFSPEMAAFHHNSRQHVQQWEFDTGIHEKLLRAPASDDVARWRHEGSRLDHAEIEAVTVDVIDVWNYERRYSAASLAVIRSEARLRHHLRAPGALVARNVAQVRRRARKVLPGRRGAPPG